MVSILSVENMRSSDAATIASGIRGCELMMRAARGVYDSVKDVSGWKAPVAIVCGSGNNAGDGYALALLLDEDGVDCTIFCLYDRFSDDGRYYYEKCRERDIKLIHVWDQSDEHGVNSYVNLEGFGTVADCLLGTGFKGEPREEISAAIDAINNSGAYIVSVDINSGLNGDTGMAKTCVRSDLTVSVGYFKPGHFLNMAKDVMKEKVNVDIGIDPVREPYKLIEAEDVALILGKRDNYSNKGTYGYMALIGGSTRYSGAIRLAYLANAAMRSGAGVVKVALPVSLVHDVAPHILESTIFPLAETGVMSTRTEAGNDACNKACNEECSEPVKTLRDDHHMAGAEVSYVKEEIDELIANVKTVAFGMGIGTGEGAGLILRHLLSGFSGTLIVDADGLTLLSGMDPETVKNRSCSLVLTPHIKEFSRLTDKAIPDILEDPVGCAGAYAAKTGAVVLLKGPATIVTDGKSIYFTDRGCPGMATAGSGDVLSGILAAVCAYAGGTSVTQDPCPGVAAAAYINGAAGERASERFGDISMIASDTVAAIPEVIRSLK